MSKKNQVNENQDNTNTPSASSKIDAIKELIFGENMQAYDSEFDTLKKDILNKKNELEDLVETVRTEILNSLDATATDINIRITELQDSLEDKIETLNETKVNRKDLGDLLVKLGEKISQ